jgi:hypothetical protein
VKGMVAELQGNGVGILVDLFREIGLTGKGAHHGRNHIFVVRFGKDRGSMQRDRG